MKIARWSALAVVLSCACCAFAFNGDEHKGMSNLALMAAIQTSPAAPPDMLAAAEKLSDDANVIRFGDVTTAVDWFQGPEILTDITIVSSVMQQRQRGAG
jgi:hypothetical protein